MVSNGLSCFVEGAEKLCPRGKSRKLEGGLWKELTGLVLNERLFVTERDKPFEVLVGISFGGVIVKGI